MSETQDVYTLAELESISFECVVCGTEVIFKAEVRESNDGGKKCPECYSELPAAGLLLKTYRQMYSDAKRLGVTVKLRGKRVSED